MSYEHRTADNFEAALADALQSCKDTHDTQVQPVFLVDSAERLQQVEQRMPCTPDSIGIVLQRLSWWIQDRWELFGDGRKLVDAVTRSLFMARAATESSCDSPGTRKLLESCAAEALPLLCAVVPRQRAALNVVEREMLSVLQRYQALLSTQGLCEASEAALLLADLLPSSTQLYLLGIDDVPLAVEALCERLARRTAVVRYDDACVAGSSASTCGSVNTRTNPSANTRTNPHANTRAPELTALLSHLYRFGEALVPSGAVRLLLPAGRYARNPLVASAALRCAGEAATRATSEGRCPLPVLISSAEPQALYEAIAPDYVQAGYTLSFEDMRPFGSTSVAQVLAVAVELVQQRRTEPEAFATAFVPRASSMLRNAFSGLSSKAAYALDASWRANRALTIDQLAHELCDASAFAMQLCSYIEDERGDAAITCFETRLHVIASAEDANICWCNEQQAALSLLRRAYTCAQNTGCSFFELLSVLQDHPLTIRAQTSPGAAQIQIVSLKRAARRAPLSCFALILCDLSADTYAVYDRETPQNLLYEKLGIKQNCDDLAQMRRQLFRLCSLPCAQLVLCRPLHTVEADESYPALMFDEVIDCYRDADVFDKDIDPNFAVPQSLLPFCESLGEDVPQQCLAHGSSDCVAVPFGHIQPFVSIQPAERDLVLLPHPIDGVTHDACLSASAIESYLECPLKWFSLRRLRLEAPDAGFGPLQMGIFAHGVLKNFYEEFCASGHVRIVPENMSEAKLLFDAVFSARLAAQKEMKPADKPLIALDAFEQNEIDQLREELHAFLEQEAHRTPRFSPQYFEYHFGDKNPLQYAGCCLRGSIDRIDVDDAGNAIIIDYKSSINSDYALSSFSNFDALCTHDPSDISVATHKIAHAAALTTQPPAAQPQAIQPQATPAGARNTCCVLPHKVQTLIYAQAVKRLLGLNPVAALYVSYGKRVELTGAFDAKILGTGDLPNGSFKRCAVPSDAAKELGVSSFAELLDTVEERIAQAIDALRSGVILPSPRGKHPCDHCPVLACEKRRDHES